MRHICPIPGCRKVVIGRAKLIAHIEEKHPHIEVLNFGGERIELKGGKQDGSNQSTNQ